MGPAFRAPGSKRVRRRNKQMNRRLLFRGVVLAAALLGIDDRAEAQQYAAPNNVCCMSSSDTITYCCIDVQSNNGAQPACDSINETPVEVVECKLSYWKQEVERLTKDRVGLDVEIKAAQDRVTAFEAARKQLK